MVGGRVQEHVLKDGMLGDYFSDQAVKNGLLSASEGTVNEEYLRIYMDGWKRGLHDFWDAVKDKL